MRVLAAADALRIVSKIGTGLDNIDLEAATDLSVSVTYTPGSNAATVAEYTVGLVLAVSRDLVVNHDLLREGGWRDKIGLSTSIRGKTIGIVGFGDIGSRVAAFLSGFNVKVLAYDPCVYTEDTDVTGAKLTPLDSLLRRSDVVTLNTELTDETRGLIRADELKRMKDSAIFINTARGPIVSESALIDALEADEIAGAGLDVFETGPLPVTSTLHEFENVIATPHIGATTRESRVRSIETLIESVFAFLNGEPVADRYVTGEGRR